MIEHPPVTLYTKPDCSGCDLVKKQFDKANVDYEVVDIMENADAYSYVSNVLGALGVPVVVSEGLPPMLGFKPDKLKTIIKHYERPKDD